MNHYNEGMTVARRALRDMAQELALGYAWIGLVPSWKAGVFLAALTWIQPLAGAVGLLGALSAWGAAHIAGADATERPVAVFNGLLSGLFVVHVWAAGASVCALAVLGGVLCGWLGVVLGRLSWSLLTLPILSLPYALVAMLTSAAGGSLSTLQPNAYVAPPAYFGGAVDAFFNAFGALYFYTSPLMGAAVLTVLLVFSRYYAVLALLGYGAAALCLGTLGAAPEHLVSTAWDSSAILAALLVGGLFATPSFMTAGLGVLAAVFAAWLALALGRISNVAHLLPHSLPFVMATWLVLYAAVHNVRIANRFNMHLPDFPERTYARTRIAKARMGSPGSVPLALPFAGAWTVSQGFSGEHTHRGLWRHALDFVVLQDGKSFAGRGSRLEDFYCYNQPVLSPVYGQVWQVIAHIVDNAPGSINVVDNWGNYVVIRMANGKFVLLAHLKPESVVVQAGAWVKPGDVLGMCGNSGRSPQPHIHMHVQTAAEAGSPTAPFHLASVMVEEPPVSARFELAVVPATGATLWAAQEGDARPLYLLAGRGLHYRVARNGAPAVDWSLHCEVDALGRTVLVSSVGARCVAESTWAVFSCYERNGAADPLLDVWLLACGYTPAAMQVLQWQDHCTSASLLPRIGARWLAVLAWPVAAFVRSHYARRWDTQAQGWRQSVQHRQALLGLDARLQALIVPQLGCTTLTAQVGRDHFVFQAARSFQRADLGVPAWDVPLRLSAVLT